MATTGTLSYTFKADVSDMKAKVADMQASLKTMGTAAKASADQVASGMQSSLKAMNDNTSGIKMNANSWIILGAAIRHGVDGLISGQSAMRVMTVEGIKASAAVGGLSVGAIAMGGAALAAAAAVAIAISTVQAWGAEYQALARTAKITGESIALVAKQQQIANQTPGNNGYDVSKGIVDFELKLREAQVVGGKLADVMAKIGIPIKDASGKARDFQSVLEDVAKAIADGSNEADKMHLVERLGLGVGSIPWLESYAAKLRDGTAAITDADKSLIELKAEAARFDEEWAKSWQSFSRHAEEAALQAVSYWRKSSDEMKVLLASVAFPIAAPGIAATYIGAKIGNKISGNTSDAVSADPMARLNTQFALTAQQPLGNLELPKKTGAGGGRDLSPVWDAAKGKAEPKSDAAESFVKSLDKQNAALKAQTDNFEKSYAEQQKLLELAKFDITVKDNWATMTEKQRAAVDGLRERVKAAADEMAANQAKLTVKEGIRDSWKELGDGIAGAIDGIAIKGQKLQDVMKNLAQSLASSALKGLLTGEGAFGKAFGLANPTGSLGGILGSLFNIGGARASGGAVEAGKTYRVGEHGEEWFKPNTSGSIIPHDQVSTADGGGGMSGGAPVFHIDARGADAAAVARLERMVMGIQSNFGKNVMGVVNVAQTRRVGA